MTDVMTALQGKQDKLVETGPIRRLIGVLGPGLITGASDDDPSGIGTYAQAGAQFGMGLLWVTLFTFPLMAVVQIASARIARVTGRGLAANLAKTMHRALLVPLLLMLFVAN